MRKGTGIYHRNASEIRFDVMFVFIDEWMHVKVVIVTIRSITYYVI